jgi:mannose-1-phosphate guanylyltransferase
LKAFLLAGGHGTRLRPLTDSVPKCLVPIRGRPLLDIWLELCARSGITDVLINLHAHPQPIEQHLERTGSPVNVRLVREDRLLGSRRWQRLNAKALVTAHFHNRKPVLRPHLA